MAFYAATGNSEFRQADSENNIRTGMGLLGEGGYPPFIGKFLPDLYIKSERIILGEAKTALKVGAHDRAIAELISAIRQLMAPEEPKKKRPIGFAPWKEK